MRLLVAFAASIVFAATAIAVAAGEVTLDVRLSQETVLLGDSVQMQVLVRGVRAARGPAADAFGDELAVRLLQEQPGSRSETVIANGRLSNHEEVWYAFVYELTPQRDGDVVVPALAYAVGGEELRTQPLRISVLGPRASPHATVEVTPVSARVYVEQPFVLELRVSIARLSLDGRLWDADPFLTRSPPELRIPWLSGTDDLAAPDTDAFLERIEVRPGSAGFAMNGLARSSFFGQGESRVFALPREAEDRDGQSWFTYTLRREVVPLQVGAVRLPPSYLVGDVVTSVESARGGGARATGTEALFVTHGDVALEVLPVPTTGRPPTYAHAVGRFLVDASATPTRAQVGDPITLRLRVDGRGRLDRVEPPLLARQADLVADFTVEPAVAPEWDGASRVFTYTVRPRRGDVSEIPPIRFPSFDPVAEKFAEQATAAIPIDVEDASEVTPGELEFSGGAGPLTSTPGAEITGGLAPNAGLAEILSHRPYAPWRSPTLWLAVLFPPVALLVALIWRRRRDAHDDDTRRAREALPDALAALAGARSTEQPDEAAGALFRTFAGFVAARTRRSVGGLTAAEIGAILTARGVDAALTRDVVAALGECEASRYGGATGATGHLAASESWLRALDVELPA